MLFAIGLLRYSRDSCNRVLGFVDLCDLLKIRGRSLGISLNSSSSFFFLAIAVSSLLSLCKSQLARGLGEIPCINEGIGSGLTLLSGLTVLLLGWGPYINGLLSS